MLVNGNKKILFLFICCISFSSIISFLNNNEGDAMSMIKWRPYEELENFDQEMENLGIDLAVDMYEDNDDVIVAMNVPGVDAKHIHIRIDDNHLHVSGEREEKKEVKEKHYVHKEIRRGSFERTISLPCAIHADKITKHVANGVLTITLPKSHKK